MPLDPISFLVETALKKALIDIPADILKKRLLQEFNPQITKIQEQLDLLHLEVEKDRIAKLKAALNFKEFGTDEQTFEALVQAEAHNRDSPVAKILLASFLSQRGKIENARDMLFEAAKLNPYLVAPFLENESSNPADIVEIGGQPWTLRLWDHG